MKDSNSMEFNVLAESHLPSDLLTPSMGSNYGLDGYPDMQYGLGVLEGVLNQDSQEPPALPTGVHRGSSEDMDLGTLLSEECLSDLGWLDPSQLQDPERLPERPVSIPELEQAWGVERRTNGVYASHQTDLDYARSKEPTQKRKADSRIIEKVVTHAMRRSIEGQHIDRIVREAAESMGEEMERVVPLLRHVAADHGLSGKVFIRASAYPGWGTGRWKEHAKRYATQAQYILVSDKDLRNATWIQNGRCVYSKKLAVTEIPWDRAHKHYSSVLKATGREVVAGDAKESLRKAFLSRPKQAVGDPGFLPTHKTPDQTISGREAKEKFDSYIPETVVYDPSHRDLSNRMAKVEKLLSQMERGNLIPAGAREAILSSGKSPESMMREASLIASKSRKEEYRGDDRAVEAHMQRIDNEHARVTEKQIRANEKLEGYDRSKCARILDRWIESGTVKRSHARKLMGQHKDIRAVVRELIGTVAEVQASESGISPRMEFDNGYNGIVEVGGPRKEAKVTAQSIATEIEASILKAASLESSLSEEAGRRSHSLTRTAKSEREVASLVEKVKREIDRGARGSYLRKFIARTIPEVHAEAAGRLLRPIVSNDLLKDTVENKNVYSQPIYREASIAKEPRNVLAGQIAPAVKWVRRTMSEGFAGKDLDSLITNRFATSLMEAAGPEIRKVREAYEGLSGFLYVDSESYASENGTKGCDSGALKHRANRIPNVLAMKRCSTCSFVRKAEDGTLRCSNYNKVLVNPKDVTGQEMVSIKSANINSSNMNDAEATASLFAPKYDPSEFGLSNDILESIDTHIPESEKVADIMFGGWDI